MWSRTRVPGNRFGLNEVSIRMTVKVRYGIYFLKGLPVF